MSHIVIVQGSGGIGGAERQGLLLAKGLVEGGVHRVTFIGFGFEGPLPDAVRQLGLPWVYVPLERPQSRSGYLAAVIRFCASVRPLSPDAILAYTAWPNIIMGLAWRITGARCGIWSQRDEGQGLYGARIERLALSLSSLVVSNSEHGAAFLAEKYGIPREGIRVVRNGVDVREDRERLSIVRRELGFGEGVPLACMAANLHLHKDHATLLRAWRILLDGWPTAQSQPVLLLAGRSDGMVTELKALAFDLKLEQSVRFLGFVNRVPELFTAVDLCVFSSHREGMPNGVLEAMAAGLSVVATDIPGIREAVGEAGYVFLSPPGDYVNMARHIRTLLMDKALRRQVGVRMKERIETEFRAERMIAETTRCIQDALR